MECNGHGKARDGVRVGAIADDGAEDHQISHGPYRARLDDDGTMRNGQGEGHERQRRSQLLNGPGDNGMRLRLEPPLHDGSETPGDAAELKDGEPDERFHMEAGCARARHQEDAGPANPTTIPTMVGPCGFAPPGTRASKIMNQNGETVTIRLARPLGSAIPPRKAPRFRCR